MQRAGGGGVGGEIGRTSQMLFSQIHGSVHRQMRRLPAQVGALLHASSQFVLPGDAKTHLPLSATLGEFECEDEVHGWLGNSSSGTRPCRSASTSEALSTSALLSLISSLSQVPDNVLQ